MHSMLLGDVLVGVSYLGGPESMADSAHGSARDHHGYKVREDV